MTEDSREQILSDFQNCTGLDHPEECIQILQQYDWQLMDAVQAVHDRIGYGGGNESTVPVQETLSSTTQSNKRQSESDEIDESRRSRFVKSESHISNVRPVRDLHFTIIYFDQKQEFTIYDSESVYQLQLKICEVLGIAPNKQQFLNWSKKSFDTHTILVDLNLPKENEIHLAPIDNSSPTHTTAPLTPSDIYHISVQYHSKSSEPITYEIDLPAMTTITEMKNRIEHLSRIPLKEQIWQGLQGAQDSETLYRTKIPRNADLILRRSEIDKQSSQQQQKSSVLSHHRHEDEPMETDHAINTEIYENDADSPQYNTLTTHDWRQDSNREPLIPDDCTDDTSALENFTHVFTKRYGSEAPLFFIGPLDEAIQQSLYLPIRDRRPLVIYLHNDQSVCANVFCTQILSAESIAQYLMNNYILWAWDVTSETNRTRLFETLRRCVGSQCVQRVSSLDTDTFPLLLIVVRSRGSLELVNVIEGRSAPDEVWLNLIQSHDSFEQQRLRDADEEIMREKRENLKKQQEDEYEQSLKADLAKAKARQDEQKASELLQKQRLEQQQESKARLPEEPSETEKNITQLKIRLPNNEGVLMRRFRISDSLQTLFDYLASHGHMCGEYKLLTTYPKRDLTTLNATDTFEHLKLYPQEQLILESL